MKKIDNTDIIKAAGIALFTGFVFLAVISNFRGEYTQGAYNIAWAIFIYIILLKD